MPALELNPLENGWELPRTATEEKKLIEKLNLDSQSHIKIGDTFYAISFRWWRSWESYTSYSDSNNLSEDSDTDSMPSIVFASPPSIDNSDLIETEDIDELTPANFLKSDLIENSDYILVPSSIWNAFKKWYGGNPEIALKVIKNGENASEDKTAEVHPLPLTIIIDAEKNNTKKTRISRMATELDLRKKICTYLAMDVQNARLWDNFDGKKRDLLTENTSLHLLGIVPKQQILLETKSDWEKFLPINTSDSTRPNHMVAIRTPVERSSIAGGPLSSNSMAIIPIPPVPPSLPSSSLSPALIDERDSEPTSFVLNGGKSFPTGQTGLVNLGNTCFMNSALQCLVHTPPLKNYFTTDYTAEINTINPLGLQGELAVAFGELLKKLWLPSKSAPLAPRAFKAKLSRFAPQFSGYNQHDSQELLAFLLDGLHEDLNRVKKKPYIEAKDSDDRKDKEVADEYWQNHKTRNDSIIVDTCQGQYKSKLVCPVCQKLSVTFDPFMYLSLPLPSKQLRSMTMTLASAEGYKPLQVVTLNVLKDGSFKDLENLLFSEDIVDEYEDLRFVEIHDFRVFRAFRSTDPLSLIHDSDKLIIYRFKDDLSNCIPAFVTLRKSERSFTGRTSTKIFPFPLVASFPKEGPKSANEFFDAIMATLKPFEKTKEKEKEKKEEKEERENANGKNKHDDKADESSPSQSVVDPSSSTAMDSSSSLTLLSSQPSSSITQNGMDKEKDETETETESDVIMMHDTDSNGHVNSDVATIHTPPEPSPFRIWVTSEKGDTSECEIVRGSDLPEALTQRDLVKDMPHLAIDFSDDGWMDYDLKTLEKMAEVKSNSLMLFKKSNESFSLHSCLENFIKEEPLGPDDMWYCPRCKKHQQATKKLDLWKLPEILVIHLKRFSYSRIFKHKLDVFVKFPIRNLDLSGYVRGGNDVDNDEDDDESHIYNLYAVSNHYGGMGGGHYTAYAKLDDGKWYNFDDSHVSPIDEESIVTPAAYVLFYQRKK